MAEPIKLPVRAERVGGTRWHVVSAECVVLTERLSEAEAQQIATALNQQPLLEEMAERLKRCQAAGIRTELWYEADDLLTRYDATKDQDGRE